MRRNGVAIRTNHIVAVALLLLAIPAGLFFYFQGVEKQNYLTSRNLRILGAQSGQLALRIENYTSNVLGNLVRSAAQDPKMEFSPERFAESLKGTFLLASSLKLDGNIDLTPDSSQTTVVTLEPKQEKEAYQLAFDFEGPIEKTGYTVKFRAVIRMDQLIISIDRGVFDDLLIVKREGDDNSVIFQQAASGPKLTRLGTVSDIDGKKIAFTEVMRSNGISYAELGGVKYRLFVQPVRLSLSTGSLKKNSRIKADSDWSLCGLVRADRFRSESMAISDSLLLLFLLAFAMVMGAWPLLKLWSHGPTDRLGRADVIFVSVSVLMITGLLTFFILDLYAYLRLEKKLDQQLEQFAESVTNDFVGELGQLCQLLDRIMPFKGSSDKEPNKTSILSSESSLLHENDPYIETIILVGTGEDKKTDGMQFQKWTIDRTKTALIDVKERAYFRNIKECRGWTKSFEKDRQFTFILEPVLSLNTGEPQAVLSMPGRANQGPPECPPAYVAAATAKMISLRGKVLPPGYGFAVIDESGRVLFHSEQSRALVENFFEECEYNRELRALVYSRARGWVNASYSGRDHRMFARPFEDLPWTLVTFRDKEYARTANLELLSASGIIYIFYALVFLLPVVLLCLWHPEWMWPNEGRKADYLHLLSANLALIVVSLSELFFIFHHHVPSLAFVLPPFVVLLNCLRLTEGAHPSKWVQFPLFQLLMFLPVLQLALGLREFAEVRSRELLVETLLSMLFLYGVFLFAFYPPRFFLARALEFLNVQFKSKLSFSVAYVLAGVSLVAIMSVLPALVFFRSAHDSEMEVLVKHGQFNLSRSLVQRDERVKKEYQDVELTGGFLEKRLKATQDIYSNFFFNTVTSLSGPQALAKRASYSPPHLFDEVTEMIRPLYNEVAIQTHDLIHDETADGSFQWEWVRESAQIKLKNSPAATFRLESSDVPVLQLPNKFGWWLGLVAIALLYFIGVYLLLRFVAMKVFLLDLLLPTVVGRSDSDLNEVTENTIVLGMPHTGKTELVDRPEFHFVDIRRIVATEEWEEALKEEVPRDKKVIAIDHLEYDMDDRECNGQKLRLLEKFLFANRILLVSSTTDPMDFSISAPQREARKEENESGGEKAREEEQEHRASLFMDRWAAVWSTFNRKVYTAKDPARQEDLEAAISESGLSLQIGKILLGECRVTGRLRRIGIEIAGLKLEGEVSEEEMIVDVLDRARAYYRALWATCSREEKLALIHFAEDGFANVEVSSLRRLVERGLLVRRPHLRPMNESFRHFVIELGRTDGVTPLADEKWHPKAAIRGTLVTAMIGTALILFLTQPHLLNLSTTFIGAAGAAIPALLKLFDLISEARTRK